MNKSLKTVLGVTLLEIMLVLAVAAMIIVMSVRYYQSANATQQGNSLMQQFTAIAAAADSLAQATGTYTGGNVGTATIKGIVGTAGMTTPWGDQITIGTVSATTFVVSAATTPVAVCQLLTSKLQAGGHWSGLTACGTTGTATFSATYTANV